MKILEQMVVKKWDPFWNIENHTASNSIEFQNYTLKTSEIIRNLMNEVFYLVAEDQKQIKRPTPKDNVIEEYDVIGLTSLHTNSDIQNFNFVFLGIEPMNSESVFWG